MTQGYTDSPRYPQADPQADAYHQGGGGEEEDGNSTQDNHQYEYAAGDEEGYEQGSFEEEEEVVLSPQAEQSDAWYYQDGDKEEEDGHNYCDEEQHRQDGWAVDDGVGNVDGQGGQQQDTPYSEEEWEGYTGAEEGSDAEEEYECESQSDAHTDSSDPGIAPECLSMLLVCGLLQVACCC